MADWYLYIIRCRDETLYTGIATDVARRFAEHQSGGRDCARYLRGRGPLELVFQKRLESRSIALKLESRIKKLPKAKKEKLLKTDGDVEVLIKQVS